MCFIVDGAQQEVRAGSSIVVPIAAVHQAWNPGDEPARVVWRTQPALQTERFFETVARLRTTGRMGFLQQTVLMRRFGDCFALPKPPRLVQTCVFGLLAPIASLTGAAADVDR